MVGDVRLELTRIAPLVPKTSASTDSANRPLFVWCVYGVEPLHTPAFFIEGRSDVRNLKTWYDDPCHQFRYP